MRRPRVSAGEPGPAEYLELPKSEPGLPDSYFLRLVGASVQANGTVANIEALMKTAKDLGIEVFISPHYYYPTDDEWQFGAKSR